MKIGPEELGELLSGRQPMPYAAFVSGVFDLYAAAQGKPFAGDKTPDYVRFIPTLHALWPHAKFVHLIRDGRDVCLSALAWKSKAPKLARLFPTWATDPLTTAAWWWDWHVGQGQES